MTYRTLLNYLKSGYKFGTLSRDWQRFPVEHINLSADKYYIHFSHFGSSAGMCTVSSLIHIIEDIFGCSSADEFTESFKCIGNTYFFDDPEYTTIFEVFNFKNNTWDYYIGRKYSNAVHSFGVAETDRFTKEQITNLYNNGYFSR